MSELSFTTEITEATEGRKRLNQLTEMIIGVEALLPIHEAQLLSYMKLANLGAGLLINFNERLLKHGIKRRLLDSNSETFS
ncbi:MAG: GxxExxY protein [Chthoniobacterales bacterium]